jgi:hypothetical protein
MIIKWMIIKWRFPKIHLILGMLYQLLGDYCGAHSNRSFHIPAAPWRFTHAKFQLRRSSRVRGDSRLPKATGLVFLRDPSEAGSMICSRWRLQYCGAISVAIWQSRVAQLNKKCASLTRASCAYRSKNLSRPAAQSTYGTPGKVPDIETTAD